MDLKEKADIAIAVATGVVLISTIYTYYTVHPLYNCVSWVLRRMPAIMRVAVAIAAGAP